MSYSGPPYWPPEYDDDWCPGQDLNMDIESCDDCPLSAECTWRFRPSGAEAAEGAEPAPLSDYAVYMADVAKGW